MAVYVKFYAIIANLGITWKTVWNIMEQINYFPLIQICTVLIVMNTELIL